MKYVLYYDYKIPHTPAYKYVEMLSSDLESAIQEADNAWNDSIYLLRIMKADGASFRENGLTKRPFKAILCRRSFGWHLNTEANSESTHVVYQVKHPDSTWYDLV